MPSTPDNQNQFLLGEINATVKGTSDDVKALRLEMGDLARKQGEHDGRLTKLETLKIAEFKHTVNNFMQADVAWKAAHDTEQKTARRHAYVVGVIVGLIASLGGFALRLVTGA